MLPSDYVQRAAPPGSMRYFTLLYTPPEQRELVGAVLVIENELRESIHAAHEVAHTRLQWWRGEIDRLINRNAQHPATQALQAALPAADFSALHECLVAADMDLARMTYNNAKELNAYLERSGGTLWELAFPGTRARQLGAFIRRVETIRDLTFDVRNGRVYFALDALDAAGISIETLRSDRHTDSVRQLLAAEHDHLRSQPISGPRPLAVLAALHARLLQSIAKRGYDVSKQRFELGPLEKVWTAWHAARRS